MTQEKIDKVKAVAMEYDNPEKGNASRILAKNKIYIDKVGIEWTIDEVRKMKDRLFFFGFDPLYDKTP